MTLFALLAALHAASSGSDSWPGWRGPNGSGIAAGSPPIEWSEQKNVRWKTPIPGKGISSPIVWGERVYLSTAIGTGKKKDAVPDGGGGGRSGPPPGERGGRGPGGPGRGAPIEEQDFVVLALERKSGAVAWQKKLGTAMPHQGTHPDGSYASPTPVTDGERLYVSFGSNGIYALSLAGDVLWSVDLGDMNITNGFGEGSSPVLCGDRLVLSWDNEGESFLVALDAKSGKERWRSARPSGTDWVTPLVLPVGGAQQIILAGVRTAAYDPISGREIWHDGESTGGRGSGPIASAVALDGLVIFARGGRGGGEACGLLADVKSGSQESDAQPERLVWKQKIDGPHVPSPLACDGKVYLLKQDSGMLSVLDPANGELQYGPARLKGVADVYASLVSAGGHLYVAGRDGSVEVLSMWPKIETLAVNTLEDGFDASPAVAGDELFLRGKAQLYCIAK